MTPFIPGQELNRLFFREAIKPLLAAYDPELIYSAALIGYGSDVLGYDTETSTDHEWGPRLLIFLREADYPTRHSAIDEMFRRTLPPSFHGYSTSFSLPDTDGGQIRHLEAGEPGKIYHHITLMTVSDFLHSELGVVSTDSLNARDWLTFPEQKLLEVTAGSVYHDGLGYLEPLRHELAYYPRDVWLFRLAAQWQRISQEEAFVGRCAHVGDELGSRIVATRMVREVMRLCFLLERRYAPYSKWLGTAFTRLACATRLTPHLLAILAAETIKDREEHLALAYEMVATMQNALAVAESQSPARRPYHDRPYQVIHAERFASAVAAAIHDAEIRAIIETHGLVGAIDQFVDCTDVLSAADQCRGLGYFFGSDK